MFEIVRKLDLATQREILASLKPALALSPLHQMVMPARGIARKVNCTGICEECWLGKVGDPRMKVSSTNLGAWGWIAARCGYHYIQEHPSTGKPFPEIPEVIAKLSREIARECGFSLEPQSAYINVYSTDGKLGVHQDNSEKALDAPVVSFSFGESCIFLRGGIHRNDPTEKLTLTSGEIMLMGGEQRLAYHGVERIVSGTSPEGLGLKAGRRINITVRQYE